MTTLRPYPAYKPSCIDWLGDFQCHWNAMKLTHADARLCGGAAARDSAGRLAAPSGMTIKRDETRIVPYECTDGGRRGEIPLVALRLPAE
jgi:hypothetical protein